MSWGFEDEAAARRGGSGDQSRPLVAPEGRDEPPAQVPGTPFRQSTITAPISLLSLGVALAAAGLAVGMATDRPWPCVVGWFMAGPLAISIFGLALSIDLKRNADPRYRVTLTGDWLRRLLMLVAVLGVTVNAWNIADAVGRGTWP
jgi:hypothetical protein